MAWSIASWVVISVLLGIYQVEGMTSDQLTAQGNVCSLSMCPGSSVTGSAVEKFCQHSNLTLSGRCCFNTTELLVGLDLHKCSLSDMDVAMYLAPLDSLMVLSLEENPFKSLNISVLGNNTAISYLSVSRDVPCPGGDVFWRNDEVNGTVRICRNEYNICESVTCPENSHCVPAGQDHTKCLCDEGYHGYKCMNSGTFPMTSFLFGLAVPSVVIFVMLWFTQRRYVKKRD